MFGFWTKWQIGKAIEQETPLPPRLLRRIRKDAECRRFYEAALAMAKRLRRDVEETVRQQQKRLGELGALEPLPSDPVLSLPRVRSLRPVLATATATLVIGLALGVGIWCWPPASPVSNNEPPLVGQQSDAAKDVAELAQIFRQIGDDIGRIAERNTPEWESVARSGEALRAPFVREAENVATDTRHLWQAFSSLISPISAEEDSDPADSDDHVPPPSSSGGQAPRRSEDGSLACSLLPRKIPS